MSAQHLSAVLLPAPLNTDDLTGTSGSSRHLEVTCKYTFIQLVDN